MPKKKFAAPKVKSSAAQQQLEYSDSSETLAAFSDDDIENADLEELGNIVHKANESVSQHLLSALQAALVAGKALLAAKEMFRYDRDAGGFRGWIEEQSISRPTAYRYMQLADHYDLVFQAETLSQANALIAQYKAEHRSPAPSKVSDIQRFKATLNLKTDTIHKLQTIAEQEGVDCSELIEGCVNRWVSRQKVDDIIEIDAETESVSV